MTTNTDILSETRQLLDDLLEQCEGELYTAVDLDTLQPNQLGMRALRLAQRIDDLLATPPAGVVQRFLNLIKRGT